jgi:hypothetical protein
MGDSTTGFTDTAAMENINKSTTMHVVTAVSSLVRNIL